MKTFIEEKKSLHLPKEVVIESWLKALLSVALLGDDTNYMNLYRYIQAILDDVDKCEFFVEEHSRDEITKFLSTLLI